MYFSTPSETLLLRKNHVLFNTFRNTCPAQEPCTFQHLQKHFSCSRTMYFSTPSETLVLLKNHVLFNTFRNTCPAQEPCTFQSLSSLYKSLRHIILTQKHFTKSLQGFKALSSEWNVASEQNVTLAGMIFQSRALE